MQEFLACTDIRLYRTPTLPEAIIQVAAKHDGYIPGTGSVLHEHWKGSELRWVNGGHVESFCKPASLIAFYQATMDSFRKLHVHLYGTQQQQQQQQLGQPPDQQVIHTSTTPKHALSV
jgi:hypothetical protein